MPSRTTSLGVLGDSGGGGGGSRRVILTLLLRSDLNELSRGRGGRVGTRGKMRRNHSGCLSIVADVAGAEHEVFRGGGTGIAPTLTRRIGGRCGESSGARCACSRGMSLQFLLQV